MTRRYYTVWFDCVHCECAITRNWISGAEYAASFLVIVVLALLSMAVLSQTRLAPTVATDGGRSVGQILRQPDIFVPMLSASVTYALMTLIKVAAPLAMVRFCGHSHMGRRMSVSGMAR